MTAPSILRWLPVAAQATLIFVLSAQADLQLAPEPLLDFVLHKAGHLAVYGVLAWLVARALAVPGRTARAVTVASLLLCIAYGASDELHQAFVHGRGASPIDVLIDGVGALLGLAIWHWWGFPANRRPRRH